jgi:predicted PurR-regulated permease PerM
MGQKIEISHRFILNIALLGGAIWLIIRISDIVLMLFVSLILMSALKPSIDRLEKLKIPRAISIFIVYLGVWIVVGLILAGIVPSLVEQTGKMIGLIPSAINRIDLFPGYQQEITRELLSWLGSLPQGLLKFSVDLFGNVINVLTTVVITFYLLLERKNLSHHLDSLVGNELSKTITPLVDRIEHRLGSWVRGELILMLSIGVLTYLGLTILGVEIALPLAIIAGILEIVPNIGPIISAVPAVIIALMSHPFLGIATAALYFLVQLFENNFLVPKVMQSAVGINPVISIISLMIGFRLAGPFGAVLAIPFVIILQILITEFWRKERAEK